MAYSSYESTENLKITYLLGAGASYYSNPIWKAQGQSMINVAEHVLKKLIRQPIGEIKKIESLIENQTLIDFFSKLKKFGNFAVEYGSIDIYAKRLSLINNSEELNELKHCLSVYFDLWENFYCKSHALVSGTDIFGNNSLNYEKIDKRYFALLSVLLEKSENEFPKLNKNISFLTWNYDLQFENAFETFLPLKSKSLESTNEHLNFMNISNCDKRKEVIHLNGYRGCFKSDNKIYENVEKKFLDTIDDYLIQLLENFTQFKTTDYSNSIKYAWEIDSFTKENAKKIMSETHILIIIGYSFPAFNRKIDSELIKEFEKNEGYKKVYYQDPNGNQELINLLFSRNDIIEPIKNSTQFHIPHEFLFPLPEREIIF